MKEFNLSPLSEEELLSDYLINFSKCCIPFNNLNEMLSILKSRDYILGIISNGITVFQLNNIKALGIENFFDAIVISEEEGTKKPDSQIFINTSMKLKVSPDECIYVGDHPINDIVGAYQAGMIGVLKENKYYSDFDTQFKIKDLLELPFLLDNI